ncbi:putative tRNA pseudouridine synthase Pus10 [Mizuhopecten yessoensis]|uniref:putative tRNA pseudouridine synthase Pus10 n=1 Tax=Mizuhopecten yessoensis TaxID=6573 RepID=UPI000B45BF85|nr:putative tRNA pseudouridine synthase Pus10 [Mizuhopecten yessoensis]
MDATMEQVESFANDDSTTADIITCLEKCGCCPRCIFRFLGEKSASRFKCYQETLKETLNDMKKRSSAEPDTSDNIDVDMSPSNDQPCPACLGILQQYLDKPFLTKIKDYVTKAEYEFKSFLCSLTVPVCVLIRERAVLVHLRDKFKSVYESVTEADIARVKDVWKWTAGPLLGDSLLVPFDQKSNFDIALMFNYPRTFKECEMFLDYQPDVFKRRKFKRGQGELFNRANVGKALKEMSDQRLRRAFQIPPTIPKVICECDDIRCTREPLYIAGRYNKYNRFLSQTPWFVDGKRKSESSVEEKICDHLKKHFNHSDSKFSASGREDVDVLMLGTGRPFVVELLDPHKVTFSKEAVKNIQKEINAASSEVQVRHLQIVTKEATNNLKEGEMEKTKTYSALCWSAAVLPQEKLEEISSMTNVVLHQKTPIRVLHRRPLATRERTVYTMSAERIDDHHFKLNLETQAGTYIKEFVHGDFGRTTPNMSTLTGVECDIFQLDVLSVLLDWPASLEDS